MKEPENQVRVVYNQERDEYQILLSTDSGESWGLDIGAKCMHSQVDSPTDEPMFIHCSFIEELIRCIRNGFELTI